MYKLKQFILISNNISLFRLKAIPRELSVNASDRETELTSGKLYP
jgi:hypothetical protein